MDLDWIFSLLIFNCKPSSRLQYGDTTHTFVDRSNYKGFFLPGYKKPLISDELLPKLKVLFLNSFSHLHCWDLVLLVVNSGPRVIWISSTTWSEINPTLKWSRRQNGETALLHFFKYDGPLFKNDELFLHMCCRYTKNLMFHRFWSVDDTQLNTDYSALRSIVVTNYEETIKVCCAVSIIVH